MKKYLVVLGFLAGCATTDTFGIAPDGHVVKLGPDASQGGASSAGNLAKTSSLGGSGGYGSGTSGYGGNLGQNDSATSSPDVHQGDLKDLRGRSAMREKTTVVR